MTPSEGAPEKKGLLTPEEREGAPAKHNKEVKPEQLKLNKIYSSMW
jgi:hypothetical protein